MNKKHIVFIPAYNESKVIGNVITTIKKIDLDLDIYVIDDGSKDDTYNVAHDNGAKVIKHPINLGGGATIRTAFLVAISHNSEYIITLDGDGQHDPTELPRMLDVMKKERPALLIGSRFLNKKDITMRSYRKWGIEFFSWLISSINRQSLTDVTSCYRIYDVKYVRKILPSLKENQYYAIEIIKEINKLGGKIIEIPIKDLRREEGHSKKGVFKYLYNLLRVTLKGVLDE